jgi:hypothetical protein
MTDSIPEKKEKTAMRWEYFEDKKVPGDWRVEGYDDANEGSVYVTIFSGPKAELRAKQYRGWHEHER